MYAEYLAPSKGSGLLDEILGLLIDKVKDPSTESTCADLIWRIIIIGWHLFVRTTEQ
jgi:hypothetical protein